MGEFFVYILKAAVCLSVFYLFYRLLLSRETFHRFNRFAVLGILLFSLLIPLCEVSIPQKGVVQQAVLNIEQLMLLTHASEQAAALQSPNEKAFFISIILWIYVAGIAFFVLRHIYSLMRLCYLLKTGKREKLTDKTILITHNRNKLSPFSWMKYIVISQTDIKENGREILIHELAHIRNRHSIDLLIADICIFFQWFNPAAWLLKQELQNIHEYEADETVIKEGVDAREYQLLIIKKAVGTRLYSMANSFNHSKLKKRITMMLKEKSSSWAKLRCLYVLPLAAIAVSAFARPEISTELKEISEVKVSDLTAIAMTNADENQREKQETTPHDSENSRAEERIFSIEQLQVMPAPERLHAPEAPAGSSSTAKTDDVDEGKTPLVILDGKEISQAELKAVPPHRIKAITVIKNEEAKAKYGEKGADGVIIVDLYTDEELAERQNSPQKNLVDKMQGLLPDHILVLLDGVEVSNVNDMDTEHISIIRVYKPADIESKNSPEIIALIEKYGEKTKNGVMEIVTKKQ